MPLTQSEINKQVWKACDTFRGTIDATQYKDYILTMLFLKYVSDVVREKREVYHERYDGNAARIERAMRLERFQIPEEATFGYIYTRKNGPAAGDAEQLEDEKLPASWIRTRSCPTWASSSTLPWRPSRRPIALS